MFLIHLFNKNGFQSPYYEVNWAFTKDMFDTLFHFLQFLQEERIEQADSQL